MRTADDPVDLEATDLHVVRDRAAVLEAGHREHFGGVDEIVGSDRDAGAVEAALANAGAAGVGSNVAVRLASVSELELPTRAGWLVTNPPYGERVGGPDLRNLYDRFGAGTAVTPVIASSSVAFLLLLSGLRNQDHPAASA